MKTTNKIYLTVSLVFTILFLVQTLKAQGVFKIQDNVYGGNGFDITINSLRMPNGNILLYGQSYSSISGDKTEDCRGLYDYWMMEMDANDNVVWDKTFGGMGSDFIRAITVNNNSLLLAGISYSDMEGDKTEPNRGPAYGTADYWMVKTDLQGNKIFDKTFGTTDNDALTKIIATPTAYYLIGSACSCGGGDKTAPGYGASDWWVVKTDTNGNKIWDKGYGGDGGELTGKAIITADEKIIICGTSGSGISGTKTSPRYSVDSVGGDYWVIAIDTNGNQLWDKSFGGDSIDNGGGIILSASNFLYIYGESKSGISGNKTVAIKGDYDRWIIKTDVSGNVIWQKDFGGLKYESTSGITFSPDNKNLIISGMSNSHAGFDKTEENFVDCALSWMQCIDTNGNQLWDKSVRTWDPDVAGSTIFIDDHCFYYITSSGSDTGGDKTKLPIDLGGNDFWVLKYCDSPTSIDQLQQNNSYDIEAYPSPANSNLTIETQNGILPKRIIITDALGKQLLNIKGQERKTEIDVSLFDSGIYFVNVQGQDGSVTVKKFIKE